MKSKSRLYYKLFQIVLLAAVGTFLAGAIFPLLFLLCPQNTASNQRDALKKWWIRWFSAIVNLHITKEGEFSAPSGLIVSNHISWLDIPLIGQYLPGYFVAKSDIADWPIFGFMSRQCGTVFIRRGEKKHIVATAEKMTGLLNQNRIIFAFPEGTTSRGDDVLHFHASLFQPALQANVAIQPVAIQYLDEARAFAPFVDDDALLPHLINILKLDKVEVRLSILPVIDSTGKTRHAVSHEAHDSILARITSDAPDIGNPAHL